MLEWLAWLTAPLFQLADRVRGRGCCICGYVEPLGNFLLKDGRWMCDEHLIQGAALEDDNE